MSKYNVIQEKEELQQIICNIISYILFLHSKHIITDRTKNEILKICKGGETYDKRANNNVK